MEFGGEGGGGASKNSLILQQCDNLQKSVETKFENFVHHITSFFILDLYEIQNVFIPKKIWNLYKKVLNTNLKFPDN